MYLGIKSLSSIIAYCQCPVRQLIKDHVRNRDKVLKPSIKEFYHFIVANDHDNLTGGPPAFETIRTDTETGTAILVRLGSIFGCSASLRSEHTVQ